MNHEHPNGYGPSTYGDAFADVYDDWYDDITDLPGTVDTIEALSNGDPVLELGVGTGRLAIPLTQRGVSVTGIDASAAMLDVLRSKPEAAPITTIEGDMAELADVSDSAFAVVFATFNTFFNLPSEPSQRRCIARCAAATIPGGHLVIEAFVPSEPPPAPEGRLDVRSVGSKRVQLTATWRDPRDQTVRGQHIDLTESGTKLRPWLLRYASPMQLDALAESAGFELVSRAAGWRCEEFNEESDRHVSTYRLHPGT